MPQKPIQFTRFDKGVSETGYGLSKHFDIYTNPNKLIPYRSTEAEADATSVANLKTFDLRNFQLGKDGKMYAMGVESTFPEVFYKTDPTTGVWVKGTTAIGNAVRIVGCFIEWQGAWWMFSGTTNVSKFVYGTNTFTNTVTGALGTAIVTVAQGVIGADDNLYMFYNNKVIRVSPAGVVTDSVLANLPSDMRITSCCRFGDSIAIGMAYGTSATATPSGVSKVFIWDMVSSTTVSDVIDWGEGSLQVLGNLEGRLIGVSDKYMSSTLGVLAGAMVVRMWAGGTPKIFKEIVSNQTVSLGLFIQDVVVKDNKMYWVAAVPFGASTSTQSTFNLGIWSFGRKNQDSNFALSIDYIEEGIDTSNFKIMSFGNAGNYWFINHSADGSITKTDDAANYTFTSIYETERIGNGIQTQKIAAVTVTTEPLPTAGQVIARFKKDEDTAFTQIFVHGVDNSQRHSSIAIENLTAGGDAVTLTIASPCVVTLNSHGLVAGNIIRFSTTGALPTGITAGLDYFVISTSLATNTFRFSATLNGSAVNTSGSQSGTHTIDRSVKFPTYKTLQLRVESTGGAVITGLYMTPEFIQDDIYNL